LAAIRQQTLCLETVFKAHLRPEQLHGVGPRPGWWWMKTSPGDLLLHSMR
jgi:hypothetical protein